MVKTLSRLLQDFFSQTPELTMSEEFRKMASERYAIWYTDEYGKRITQTEQRRRRRTAEGYPLNTPEIEKIVEQVQHENGVNELRIIGTFLEEEFKDVYKNFRYRQDLGTIGLSSMTLTSVLPRLFREYVQVMPILCLKGNYENQEFWKNVDEVIMAMGEDSISEGYREGRRENTIFPMQNDSIDEIVKQHTGFIDISSLSASSASDVLESSEERSFVSCGVAFVEEVIPEAAGMVSLYPPESWREINPPVYMLHLGFRKSSEYALNYQKRGRRAKCKRYSKKPFTHPSVHFFLMGPSALNELKWLRD